MKAFRFELESVLGWRRVQLDVEQSRGRTLAQQLEKLESRRQALVAQGAEAQRFILQAATLESPELSAAVSFPAYLQKQQVALHQERTTVEAAIEVQRLKTVEAQRRLRLLERLREKRLAGWHVDLDREQETFAAEAFLARHHR